MKTLLLLVALCIGAYAQFSSTGQTAIVNAHNALRSSIARGKYVAKGTPKPAASNMRKMKWDSAIANSAQAYANQCKKVHSQLPGLGENLYFYWTTGTVSNLDPLGASASAEWEKEFQKFGWASNKLTNQLFNTGIGHATQMAWSTTNLIGCGVKSCGKDTTNGMNFFVVVCQYKPPGNYLDQNIYTTGATCGACPSGTKCETASGLCA